MWKENNKKENSNMRLYKYNISIQCCSASLKSFEILQINFFFGFQKQ